MDLNDKKNTFLGKVVAHIQENHSENHSENSPNSLSNGLSRTCIVVPSRRAVGELQKMLSIDARIEENKNNILAIDDFITVFSGFARAESLELLLEFQLLFKENIKDENFKKDNLLSWLPILLRDFNQIDQNLVDTEQFFKNLADIKKIEKWDIPTENTAQKTRMQRYFTFWEELKPVYTQLTNQLKEKKIGYQGLLYRYLAENAEELLVENAYFDYFVFAGFNTFSKSEEKIISVLKKHNKITLLWDTDSYYMNEGYSPNQAGFMLKNYKNEEKHTWKWTEDNFAEIPKTIEIIASPNTTLQTKIVPQLLQNWQNEQDEQNHHNQNTPQTVVVLPDDNLLLPLLYSIEDKEPNITMGLSLKKSNLFNLVDLLFKMQKNKHKHKAQSTKNIVDNEGVSESGDTVFEDKEKNFYYIYKYDHKTISRLFNHPLVRHFEKQTKKNDEVSFLRDALAHITHGNRSKMSKREILNFPARLLDDHQNKNTSPELLDQITLHYAAFEKILKVLVADWNDKIPAAMTNLLAIMAFFKEFYNDANSIELEYLQRFEKILQKLAEFVDKKSYALDYRTFKSFLYQLVADESIVFDSERDSSVQIMGLLETRALDFEQVIILSMNEGNLPAQKKVNSLIPLDIARAFNLPTYQEQENITTYHFYRLLQRAKKVALVYISPHKSDKSRFLMQLEYDLCQKYNHIVLTSYGNVVVNDKENIDLTDLFIEKTPEIIKKIKAKLISGLAPTNIDDFVKCSLMYYFKQIAEIKEAEEVEEEIEAGVLGTIVHEILEDIFRRVSDVGRKIVTIQSLENEMISIEANVREKFTKEIYKGYELEGNNYLTMKVCVEFVQNFLQLQIAELEKTETKTLKIIGLEVNQKRNNDEPKDMGDLISIQSAELEINNFDNEGVEEKITVKIKGIIDRIDEIDGKWHIIDYKTGNVLAKDLVIKNTDIPRLADDSDLSKVRQLWLYKYILYKNITSNTDFATSAGNKEIEAGIYSMRNIEKFLALNVQEKVVSEKKAGKKKPADDTQDSEKSEPTSETTSKNVTVKLNMNDFITQTEDFLKQILTKMLDKTQPFEKTNDLTICQYCSFNGICGRQ